MAVHYEDVSQTTLDTKVQFCSCALMVCWFLKDEQPARSYTLGLHQPLSISVRQVSIRDEICILLSCSRDNVCSTISFDSMETKAKTGFTPLFHASAGNSRTRRPLVPRAWRSADRHRSAAQWRTMVGTVKVPRLISTRSPLYANNVSAGLDEWCRRVKCSPTGCCTLFSIARWQWQYSGFTNCFECKDCDSHSVAYSSQHLILPPICPAGH